MVWLKQRSSNLIFAPKKTILWGNVQVSMVSLSWLWRFIKRNLMTTSSNCSTQSSDASKTRKWKYSKPLAMLCTTLSKLSKKRFWKIAKTFWGYLILSLRWFTIETAKLSSGLKRLMTFWKTKFTQLWPKVFHLIWKVWLIILVINLKSRTIRRL